jgi:hypothetical protein
MTTIDMLGIVFSIITIVLLYILYVDMKELYGMDKDSMCMMCWRPINKEDAFYNDETEKIIFCSETCFIRWQKDYKEYLDERDNGHKS